MGQAWIRRVWPASEATFGIATLCILTLAAPLVEPNHLLIYHFAGPVYRLFAKVLLDWAALWLVLAALLLVPRWASPVRIALLLLSPGLLLADWSLIRVWPVPRWIALGLLLAVGGAALAARRKANVRAKLLGLSDAVLKALSVSGCVVLLQVLYCAFAARGLNVRHNFGLDAPPSGPAGAPRIVVVLFDELSYAQVFARPPATPQVAALQLPAFDELAHESVVFAGVRPESDHTDQAVPALLSGAAVTRVRATADGRQLAMRGDAGWTMLRGDDTIFGDALRAGYRVGVSGWYNPYCRLLAGVVDACAWSSPATMRVSAGDGRGSLLQDALQPLRRVWRELRLALPAPRPAPEEWQTAEHVRDYLAISAAGDRILANGHLGFVFLHLPIPHPGGIYDRATARLGPAPAGKTGYRDNLVLSDLYLAHVRRVLEARGEWHQTTLVVLGDHSWRTRVWRNGADWTPDDERASAGGHVDDRPVLLLKLAGQTAGTVITTPFAERRLRTLLAAVEQGQLRTAAELQCWAVMCSAGQGSSPPTGPDHPQ